MFSAVLLKTFSGAWVTSRRMQCPILSCQFCGVESGDQLQHLVHCDRLWHIVSSAFLPFLPHLSDPAALLGVSPVSLPQLYGVYIAFHVYHSVRVARITNYSEFIDIARAYVDRCWIAKHLTLVKLGRTACRFSSSAAAAAASAPSPRGASPTDLLSSASLSSPSAAADAAVLDVHPSFTNFDTSSARPPLLYD